MQLLEATVRRSHLRTSIRQELGKHQLLNADIIRATRRELIDEIARQNGMVMQVASPMFIAGHRKGR
jgi:hypothetical protein